MKRYLLASILLHALLVLPLLLRGNPAGGFGDYDEESKATGGAITDKDIAPKPIEVEIVMPKTPEDEGQKQEPAKDGCPDGSFGGIGVYFDMFSGDIDKVMPGYAADRAGVKAGDQIRNLNPREIRGEVGTFVQLIVYRPSTGETATLNIRRDKICLQKKPKKQ